MQSVVTGLSLLLSLLILALGMHQVTMRQITPVTMVFQDCQDNTVGDRCQTCAPGYYGDPTAGTPNDCRLCPCPLTTPGNQ